MEQIKKHWPVIAEGAAYLVGAVTGFILLPAQSSQLSRVVNIEAFSVFLVAVFAALILVAAAKWKQRKQRKWWLVTTLVLFGGLMLSIYVYSETFEHRTCEYRGELMFTGGDHYTKVALDHMAEYPVSGCAELLANYRGVAEDAWTPESIKNTRQLLTSFYLLSVILGSLVIVSLIQVVTIGARNTDRI